MKKLISISGTHCTGKTTLVNHLKSLPEFKDVTFLQSSSKGLDKLGLTINTDGNSLTQLYCACRDFTQFLEGQNREGITICDRSILDTYIYTIYLNQKEKVDNLTTDMVHNLSQILNLERTIDKVFILKPSFELVEEEGRSLDKDFQLEIDKLFGELINFHKQFSDEEDSTIEVLPTTLEEQVQIIKNYLEL